MGWRQCCARVTRVELLETIGQEWRADSHSLVLDGRYWRELYGGALLGEAGPARMVRHCRRGV